MPRRRTTDPLPVRTTHRRLELTDSKASIAVVADTHSRPHSATPALLADLAPAAILHGGDIGDLGVLDRLAEIAPVIAVRGNIDARALSETSELPPDHVVLSVRHGERALRVLLTHIAVRGPRLRADARRLAEEHRADLVVCGHSHVPLIARDGPRVVFNPGSIGPRRFTLPITFGVLRFGADGLSMHHIDCETGLRWRPPAR